MSKEESFTNFRDDHNIRSQSNKDMLYFLGDHKKSLKDDKKNTRFLFDDIVNFFYEKLKIKEDNKYIKPTNVTFHKVFGWVFYGEKSKSYLGKCSINGNVNIQIGNSTYASGTFDVNGNANLNIGSFTSIANGVEFFTSNINHPLSYVTTFNLHSNSRLVEDKINLNLPNFNNEIINLENKNSITIGNDVWIGRDAMIMPGVIIPDGCVIGSKSLVTKNLEPYGIYVGTPAKLVRFRFDQNKIKELLEINWWDWPFEKIKKNKYFFDTDLSNYKGNLKNLIV